MNTKYTFSYEGESYTCEIIPAKRKTLSLTVSADGQVRVRVPREMSMAEIQKFIGKHAGWIARKLQASRERPGLAWSPQEEKRLREQARAILTLNTVYYARIMGVTYNRIFIKDQKTIWGSCSAKGNINYNWKLILTGPDLLEYVVVHELAHRKHMDHSPAFWKEVERILPDYRERRARLKQFRI